MKENKHVIKSLTIEGFQSHVNTKLDFSGPGELMVLVGDGGRGKTAVARALKWVTCNVPSGDSFINWTTNTARVSLEMASGATVVRERSRGGVNRYTLIAPNGEKQVFEGFGLGVPEEIRAVTGIRDVSIGDSRLNLNISGQLDGPFLGSNISGGQRARILGALAGTEEIDMAIKAVSADAVRSEQERKRAAAMLERTSQRLEEFKHLPRMYANLQGAEFLIEKAEEKQKQIDEKQALLEHLQNLLDHQADLEKSVSGCKRALEKYRNLDKAGKQLALAEKSCKEVAQAVRLLAEAEQWVVAMDAENMNLEKVADLPIIEHAAGEAWPTLETLFVLTELSESYEALKAGKEKARAEMHPISGNRLSAIGMGLQVAKNESLQKLIDYVRLMDGHEGSRERRDTRFHMLTQAERELAAAEEQYKKFLKDTGVCPTCGQEIEEVCIHVS